MCEPFKASDVRLYAWLANMCFALPSCVSMSQAWAQNLFKSADQLLSTGAADLLPCMRTCVQAHIQGSQQLVPLASCYTKASIASAFMLAPCVTRGSGGGGGCHSQIADMTRAALHLRCMC